jgi:NTP pyrophosphatase (non-canonical NTP hydrolase)
VSNLIDDLMARAVNINMTNGWHDDNRTVLDECMLLVTEVAEMAEAFRDNQMVTTINEKGKPEGFPSECADVFIRLLDTCYRHNIDLTHEVKQKLEFNATRGYRHGGKAL